MIAAIRELVSYRELMATLAWKAITVRYKQAYLGLAWAVIKPLTLMSIFVLLRAFVSIDSGGVPYPVLAYAALLPWMLFQESSSDGVNSIVSNTHLIKKIYFPREIFPLTAVLTKLIEFAINFAILLGMMALYGIWPSVYALWVPLLVLYTILVALAIALAGSALNVYYRDVGSAIPILMMVLMYASPVIYPLSVVREKLLVARSAGDWSQTLFFVYTLNPLAGIIDAFQRVLLRGMAPDLAATLPGLLFTVACLPLCYLLFKRAETYFADVV
jgi:lipopolysaccharide transport system permease protein